MQRRLRTLRIMTNTENSKINYISAEEYVFIYDSLRLHGNEGDEPLEVLNHDNYFQIDNLAAIPQQFYFGTELYSTLVEKASIIFYTINKRHIFGNGNKRMSVISLVVFLAINLKKLGVGQDEMRDKALWLAKTTHEHDFDELKAGLVRWIDTNMVDLEV